MEDRGVSLRGREPDEFRYNIETGALDSTSVRLSWNPAREWSLQASWAHQVSPEQLEPTKNENRLSASVIYTHQLGDHIGWSTTAAWGRRRSTGDEALNAYVLESALTPSEQWTLFVRAEREKNDELIVLGPMQGTAYTVGKTSIGAIRYVAVIGKVRIGLGALYAFNFVPDALAPLYGRTDPQGTMVFVRLSIE